MKKTVIVLGAGIQGTCVALMFQKHGYHVQLVDKCTDVISRSSLNYEGRIHLGFVYGMDRTLQTGYKMIRDALHFAPIMEYLLDEKLPWRRLKSSPSLYLVAEESMLSVGEIEEYFQRLDQRFREHLIDPGLHYLGERPASLFSRIDLPSYVSPASVSAAFQTVELSADQQGLKNIIKRKIASSPHIEVLLGCTVRELKATPGGFDIRCTIADGTGKTLHAETVVNCLWENRLHFDRQMGMPDNAQYSIRLKYGLLVKPNAFMKKMASLNIIHGSYGAFVSGIPDQRMFFAWYPTFMRGLMEYAPIPEEWEKVCDGQISPQVVEELRVSAHRGFQHFIPELPPFEAWQASAGLILAEGTRDITDRGSLFHSRNETPVFEKNGYYSVNTSKYTSAPRNTMLLEKMLFG